MKFSSLLLLLLVCSSNAFSQYIILNEVHNMQLYENDYQVFGCANELIQGRLNSMMTLIDEAEVTGDSIQLFQSRFLNHIPKDFFSEIPVSVNILTNGPKDTMQWKQTYGRFDAEALTKYLQITFQFSKVGGNMPDEIIGFEVVSLSSTPIVQTGTVITKIEAAKKKLLAQRPAYPPPPPPSPNHTQKDKGALVPSYKRQRKLELHSVEQIPRYIFKFEKLEELDIHCDCDYIPDQFGAFQYLKKLRIRTSHRIKDPVNSIGDLNNLEQLETNLVLPETLSRLKKLKIVELEGSSTSKLPQVLAKIENLSSLRLKGFSGKNGLDSRQEFKRLKFLSLIHSTLPSLDLFPNLSSLRCVRCYNLDFTMITPHKNIKSLTFLNSELKEVPEEILKLPNLETLNLRMNVIREIPWLKKIKRLKNLKSIDLSLNFFSKKESIEAILKKLNGVTYDL